MHASRQEPGLVTSRAVDFSAFRRSLLLALVAVLLPAAAGAQSLIANGDFAQGLTGWRVWKERGALSSVVNGAGQLHLAGSGINGGVYQQFSTGGAGRTITIDGWWASSPTVAQGQWAEVLVINGSALPVDGQDVNGDQAGVALVYKAETWTKPAGWSGDMRQTAVRAVGSFVSAGNVATIVLKTGNPAGVTSGTLFDNVVVGGPAPPPNRPPVAQATAMPSSGVAPLAVRLDGSGSSDPDGDALAYGWVFGDGQSGSGATVNHTYASAGSYTATLTVSDGKGGTAKALLSITATAPPSVTNLIANGDFAQGLTGWRVWKERGALSSVVNGTGQLHLAGSGINGGVYQQFSTGGAGRTITIDGWWASSPTVAQGQWAEVLVINGSALPVDGQDVNGDQAGVALIYKAETWAKPAGWSGEMRQTAVRVVGSFVSAGNVATIVLKTGNPAGVTSGALFDNVVVGGPAPPPNRPPVAQATAMPSSGAAPLAVRLDGSGSSDPDGDALAYGWVFGDGQSGSGTTVNHTYASAGSYTATLTVSDGKGGSATARASISVGAASPPSVSWDARLSTLGIQLVETAVVPGTWYWKLVLGRFESDGEILPPPDGGSESNGTHAIYVKALDGANQPIENQEATVSWPTGQPTSSASLRTKGSFDGYWGNFPMAGGWCPYYPDGPRGPYGARMAGAPSDEVWGMGMPCNRHVSYRYVWRWTQKPAVASKLTMHAGFGGPLSMQFLTKAKPGLVKILDSFGAAAEVKRVSPQTKVIGRAYLASQPMDGDPVQRAREWWSGMRSVVLQYPEVDYWEGYNEPVVQTTAGMDWYARFEVERVRLLAAEGKKACIGNFSVGNPDLPLWPAFYPAIDAAQAQGGILGLHEYGTPMQQWFDEGAGEGWLCGRYRKLYRQYLIPSGRRIRLAITECGVDVVPPVGWKNHFTGEQYLEQLKWYDSVLKQDDYVLGATIFALEIPGWWDFDIAPIVDPLASYVGARP